MLAQSAKDDAMGKEIVSWETKCAARGCLLQTDVLRGVSGDTEHPPDPKDARDYVSLDVAIDRSDRKPAYFLFTVDPRAEQKNGIFLAFVKTVPDGKSFKAEMDATGAFRVNFDTCKESGCFARVLGGIAHDKDEKEVDLLSKFRDSSLLLVLYLRDGKAYRTSVLLKSFQLEYEAVMQDKLPHSAGADK